MDSLNPVAVSEEEARQKSSPQKTRVGFRDDSDEIVSPTKEDDASIAETEEESLDESGCDDESASTDADGGDEHDEDGEQDAGPYGGNRDYVVTAFEDALSVQRTRLGPDHPLVTRTLHSLSIELRDRGRYDEAARCLTEAMDRVGRRTVEDINDPDRLCGTSEVEMAALLSSMGNLCRERGMEKDSAGYYRSSVASLMAAGLSESHPKVVMMKRIAERVGQRRRQHHPSSTASREAK